MLETHYPYSRPYFIYPKSDNSIINQFPKRKLNDIRMIYISGSQLKRWWSYFAFIYYTQKHIWLISERFLMNKLFKLENEGQWNNISNIFGKLQYTHNLHKININTQLCLFPHNKDRKWMMLSSPIFDKCYPCMLQINTLVWSHCFWTLLVWE